MTSPGEDRRAPARPWQRLLELRGDADQKVLTPICGTKLHPLRHPILALVEWKRDCWQPRLIEHHRVLEDPHGDGFRRIVRRRRQLADPRCGHRYRWRQEKVPTLVF